MATCTHDLVVRARGGDAAALDRLLFECRYDARRYALRHCVTSEVDDAVQEALLVFSMALAQDGGVLRRLALHGRAPGMPTAVATDVRA